MSIKKLNWALMSTARINDRIIPAIKQSKYCNLYAVASLGNKNLKAYAKKRKISVFYNSYNDLLKDKNIDVIYIYLPNHLHSKWIIKAVNAKKNVLCEKPITTSINEINKIEKYAKKNNVAVQEATMMRFHPQTLFTQKIVKQKKIGDIRFLSAIFSFHNKNFNDIRYKYKNGGGSLWDVGSYCISYARSVLNMEPTKVFAKKIHTAGIGKVDSSLSGYLVFEKKIEMQFFCSFRSFPFDEVVIVGDKGTIRVKAPYCNNDVQGSVSITTENKKYKKKSLFGDELNKKKFIKKFNVNAYFEQIDSFSKTILFKKPQIISLKDSKNNILALTSLLESAKTGKLLSIKK
jgi:xylose dehydrogenase (NAD/NADP)